MSFDVVKQFIARIFHWRILKILVISEREQQKLNERLPECSDLYQKIVVWRKSVLLAIIPVVLTVLALDAVELHDTFGYYDYYPGLLTGAGRFSLISNGTLSGSVVMLGILLTLYIHYNLKLSQSIFCWTVLLALLIKLWPSLLQSDDKFDLDKVATDDQEKNDLTILLRMSFTIKNAMKILPIIIAFPRGAIAGALAMFGLDPTALTPKLLLMFFYPFATLLLILGTSSLVQVAGDPLLASSLACFYFVDALVFYSYEQIIAGKCESFAEDKKAKIRLSLKITGILLFFIWVCVKMIPCSRLDITDDENFTDDYYLGYTSSVDIHCVTLREMNLRPRFVYLMICKFLRNLLLSKLLFFDLIMRAMSRFEPDVFGPYQLIKTSNETEDLKEKINSIDRDEAVDGSNDEHKHDKVSDGEDNNVQEVEDSSKEKEKEEEEEIP